MATVQHVWSSRNYEYARSRTDDFSDAFSELELKTNCYPDVQTVGVTGYTREGPKFISGRQQKAFILFYAHLITNGLKIMICDLVELLLKYDFDVTVDLDFQMPLEEWARWFDSNISAADWILMIPSRSHWERMHQSSNSTSSYLTTEIRRDNYINSVLHNILLTSKKSKTAAVVLQREDDDIQFVPLSLRDPGNIYRIFKIGAFNYAKMDGPLERLICRMAGINRVPTAERTGQIVKLQPFLSQSTHTSRVQSIPQSPERLALSGPEQQSAAESRNFTPAYSRPTPVQHGNHWNGDQRFGVENGYVSQPEVMPAPIRPQHYPAREFPRDHNSYFEQPSHNPSYYNSSGHASFYSGYNEVTAPPKRWVQAPPQPPPSRMVPAYIPERRDPQPAPPRVAPLPKHVIPKNSQVLWELSLEVMEWKFLARYLDLDEDTIEEIDEYTRPNKTRDKALKVFNEWVSSNPAATWEQLGMALLEADNMLLHDHLVELLSSNTILTVSQ